MNGGHLSSSICGLKFIPFRLVVSELEGGFKINYPYCIAVIVSWKVERTYALDVDTKRDARRETIFKRPTV